MKTNNLIFTTLLELSSQLEEKKFVDNANLLIQVFVENPEVMFIELILEVLRAKFPLAKLIGSTSDGVIESSEVYVGTKSVVSFSYFEKTTLSLAYIDYKNEDKSSFYSGKEIAQKLCSKRTKLLIAFADGLHTNGEDFVHGIESVAPNVIVTGGLAGDNGELRATYIFTKEGVITQGAVAVALESDVLCVNNGYTFDWKPIGKKMKVTKAVKNRVYELDDIPLVEIYAKYMGRELACALPKVGIEFPLIIEENGLLVGRAPILAHDDGSLTFGGNIAEGEMVRFGVGNIDEILRRGTYNIHKIISSAQCETESIFIYSCMARRRFMQEQIADELKFLNTLAPTVGFFTYGEFFHAPTGNRFLNETMTMVLLSESTKRVNEHFFIDYSKEKIDITNEQVIAHLANAVADELEELNHNLERRILENSNLTKKQAYLEKLTGLPNRLSLINRLGESIGKTILLLNIDDFTIINDFYGHAVGDQILIQLAQLLEQYTQKHAMELFKLPSDEYAIIADIEHEKEKLETVIHEILTLVHAYKFRVEDGIINLTITLSAAFINMQGSGLINSDMALKLAKRAGKSFMIYNEDLKLSQEYAKNIATAKLIKNAIENDGIIPYFQPIYDLKTMKIEKYEALIRLKKDNGEVLSPYFFLEIAQKIKLYPKLTRIMIEKTFAYFQKKGLNFSINLAFDDITNEDTRKYLFNKIQEYGIAKHLTIEILETQELEDDKIMFDFIDAVYAVGAHIAIDDFGSGFANFEHMTKNRSDIMKIDGSLIRNIDTDENARLVVETIVIFAKKLKKKIVAEFVHSDAILQIVKNMEIDYAQGYLLAEPAPEVIASS